MGADGASFASIQPLACLAVQISVRTHSRYSGTFPHFIAHLIVIGILVAFPSIILWLPSQMGN